MKPDGKLATACTMIMVFSSALSLMLYFDEDVVNAQIDKILQHPEVKKKGNVEKNAIKKLLADKSTTGMVVVPVMCSVIQATSLFIFFNAKTDSNSKPKTKMFVAVGILMSIAVTTTLYNFIKSLASLKEQLDGFGLYCLNHFWPPSVALVTTAAHCYVY